MKFSKLDIYLFYCLYLQLLIKATEFLTPNRTQDGNIHSQKANLSDEKQSKSGGKEVFLKSLGIKRKSEELNESYIQKKPEQVIRRMTDNDFLFSAKVDENHCQNINHKDDENYADKFNRVVLDYLEFKREQAKYYKSPKYKKENKTDEEWNRFYQDPNFMVFENFENDFNNDFRKTTTSPWIECNLNTLDVKKDIVILLKNAAIDIFEFYNELIASIVREDDLLYSAYDQIKTIHYVDKLVEMRLTNMQSTKFARVIKNRDLNIYDIYVIIVGMRNFLRVLFPVIFLYEEIFIDIKLSNKDLNIINFAKLIGYFHVLNYNLRSFYLQHENFLKQEQKQIFIEEPNIKISEILESLPGYFELQEVFDDVINIVITLSNSNVEDHFQSLYYTFKCTKMKKIENNFLSLLLFSGDYNYNLKVFNEIFSPENYLNQMKIPKWWFCRQLIGFLIAINNGMIFFDAKTDFWQEIYNVMDKQLENNFEENRTIDSVDIDLFCNIIAVLHAGIFNGFEFKNIKYVKEIQHKSRFVRNTYYKQE